MTNAVYPRFSISEVSNGSPSEISIIKLFLSIFHILLNTFTKNML